jgi:FlaA1/EpsC-like NDP-sugar epimerase
MSVEAGAPVAERSFARRGALEGRIEALPHRREVEGVVPAVAEPADELLTKQGALINGADVPTSARDSARRRLLALADVIGLLSAYAVMWALLPPSGNLSDRLGLGSVLIGWVVLHKMLGLYDRDDKLIHKSTLDELPKLLHSLTLGALLVFMAGPVLTGAEIGREQTALFWALGICTLPLSRALARTVARRAFAPERCLIVGSGSVAQIVARKLQAHPEHGVELVGFVDESRGLRRQRPPIPMLGDVSDFAGICRTHEIERVVIAFSSASNDQLLEVVRAAKRSKIKITIVPRLFEVIGHSVIVDEVEGMTMLGLRGLTRSHSSLMIKRAIDIAGAGIGLVILSPLMLAVAIAIKATSRGS